MTLKSRALERDGGQTSWTLLFMHFAGSMQLKALWSITLIQYFLFLSRHPQYYSDHACKNLSVFLTGHTHTHTVLADIEVDWEIVWQHIVASISLSPFLSNPPYCLSHFIFLVRHTHTHHQKVWKNSIDKCLFCEWIYWFTVLPQVEAVRLIHWRLLVGNWCAMDCEPSQFIYFYFFMARMTDDVLSLSPPFRLSVFPQYSK